MRVEGLGFGLKDGGLGLRVDDAEKVIVLAKVCGPVLDPFANTKASLHWKRRTLLGETPLSGNVLGGKKLPKKN